VITISEVLVRVLVATVLGGVVGIERERSERAAGLRTHAMVGLGAAAFMILSAFGFKDILGAQAVVLDPSRVAAQIVTGIGFLGAGTIIFQREMVRGLTTAASIWAVAAIGAAVGGRDVRAGCWYYYTDIGGVSRSKTCGKSLVSGSALPFAQPAF